MINIEYDHDKIINVLIECQNSKTLIPFIGSGFSSCVAPIWRDFVKSLYSDESIEIPAKIMDMIDTNPLEAMEYFIWIYAEKMKTEGMTGEDQYYYNEGKKRIINYINKKLNFPVQGTDGKKIHINHNNESISLDLHESLLKKFFYLYTTNWDNLLENVSNFRAIAVRSQLESLNNGGMDKKVIIKFHGDMKAHGETIGDPLIISKTDYWNRILDSNNFFDNRFKSDLQSNRFLFIGYGYNDPNIELIVYQTLKLIGISKKEKVYWAVTEYRDHPRPLILYKHSGIQPIYLISETNEKILKDYELEKEKICKGCTIKNRTANLELQVCNYCNNCKDIEELKEKIKTKKNEFINEGIKTLLGKFKDLEV